MRSALLFAMIGVLALLAGCSQTVEPPDPLLAAAAPTAPIASAPTASRPPDARTGEVVRNGGITLTVLDARPVDSVEMNESNFRPGSGYEEYTTTRAEAGGRFVMVRAHVVNDAQTSLDLTCSLPIATVLIDARQRNFDPIDDLYKIKGNPECNDQLQPGFEAEMTWVYLVPEDAQATGWGFSDATDYSTFGDYSTVRFDA